MNVYVKNEKERQYIQPATDDIRTITQPKSILYIFRSQEKNKK